MDINDCRKICEAWAEAGNPGSKDGTVSVHSCVNAKGIYDAYGNKLDSVSVVQVEDYCEYHVYASEKDMYEAWISDWLKEASCETEEFTPEYVSELFDKCLDEEICEKVAGLYANKE